MKTATMTQSAAVVETPAAPVLRALNPRTLSIDIVLPVLNEVHVIARSVSTLHAYLSQHMSHRWRIIIADMAARTAIGSALSRGTAHSACRERPWPGSQASLATELGRYSGLYGYRPLHQFRQLRADDHPADYG